MYDTAAPTIKGKMRCAKTSLGHKRQKQAVTPLIYGQCKEGRPLPRGQSSVLYGNMYPYCAVQPAVRSTNYLVQLGC